MSLTARHLEENGIATVVIGSAKDIVELCGAPRFLFSDFPLGNPCGKPGDVAMQQTIVNMALELLENALYPMTTIQTPFTWDDQSDAWRFSYMEV